MYPFHAPLLITKQNYIFNIKHVSFCFVTHMYACIISIDTHIHLHIYIYQYMYMYVHHTNIQMHIIIKGNSR